MAMKLKVWKLKDGKTYEADKPVSYKELLILIKNGEIKSK